MPTTSIDKLTLRPWHVGLRLIVATSLRIAYTTCWCTAVRVNINHSCKARARINRKIENSTPCKTVTSENFSSKLCTRDYVGYANTRANIGANQFNGGFCTNRWSIPPLWLFWLSCSVMSFFLDPAPRSNCWTDFHALWLKRLVSAQGGAFSDLER